MLSGARLLYLVFHNFQAQAKLAYEMSVPIVFNESLYFDKTVLMGMGPGKKMVNIYQLSVNSTLAGRMVQFVQKALNALTMLFPPTILGSRRALGVI